MENMTTPAVYHDATGDEEYEKFFKSVDVMSAVIYSLVCVLGVLGNGMVIWVAVVRIRAYLLLADEERPGAMKKEVSIVWFLNLAVADFLATAFLPLNITQRARDNQWPFGWFMCKMDGVVFYMNMYASIYILVLISVDRCVGMAFLMTFNWFHHRHRTVRNASLVSLGVWVMALALSIPHVISRELDFGLCYDYPEPSLVITNLVVGFGFPLFVIVSCNSVIFYMARHISRVRKVLAAVIVVFFMCWAPFHIIQLIRVVVTPSKTLDVVLEFGVPISLTVAYLNSCLNPLLYMFVASGGALRRCGDIKKALEKLFAEDQPDNAPTDLELKDVILPTE